MISNNLRLTLALFFFYFILSGITNAQCTINADFSFSPDNAPAHTSIQFQAQVQNAQGNVSYQWDFGDGNVSTLQNPVHNYNFNNCQGSTYQVSLTVTDTASCFSSVQKTVSIDNNPHLKLNDLDVISPFSNCENSPSLSNPDFTIYLSNATQNAGAIASYQINWGDGQSNTYQNSSFPISHTYNSLGLFTLTFSATDTLGCTWDTVYTVANQSNPAIGISSMGYTQGCAPQTFHFVMSQYQSNSPGTYYVWDFGDGTPNVTWNYNQPFINDTITHTFDTTSCHQPNNYFTVSVTAYNECDYTIATVSNIRIYQPPAVDIQTSNDTACAGNPVQFMNNTVAGFGYSCNSIAAYNWNFGDSTSSSNTSMLQSPTHTYNNPGTYKIVLEADNGICGVKDDTIELVVVAPPNVAAIADTNEVCENGIINFTNLTTGTTPDYQWTVSPASGYNNISGTYADSNLTLQFLQEGSYDITLTASNFCSADDTTISIQVNAAPEATVSSIGNFCGSATINPQAQYNNHGTTIHTYSWTLNGGTPSSSSNAQPGTITYNNPGNYDVILQADNACGIDRDTVSFIIYSLPNIQATASSDTICDGETITLNGSGANSYNWSPGSAVSNATGSTVNSTPLTNTQYILQGTDNNGCSNTDTINVQVNPLPSVSLTASPSVICPGDTANITASGASTYSFSSAVNLTQTGTNSVVLSPAQDVKVFVSGIDNNGCMADDSITIGVNQPAALTFSPSNPEVCRGDSMQLAVSGSQTYQWFENGIQLSNTNSLTISPQQNTTYVVIATDQHGCESIDSITVQVNALPGVTATTALDTICQGQNTQLFASGATTYAWQNASTLNTNGGSPVTASPSTTETYYVTGTDNNGCKNTDSVDVTVVPVPVITVSPSSPGICFGDSVVLTASGAPQLSWAPLSGLNTSSGSTVVAKPASTTTYTVNGTNDFGCQASASATVTVHSLPSLNITPSTPVICEGDSILLQVSGASTYNWSPVQSLSSASASQVYASPSVNTSYTVNGIDNNGCEAQTSVNVAVNPIPAVSVSASKTSICEGETIQLNANGPSNFIWTDNNGNTVGSGLSISVQPVSTTTYYGMGINQSNCQAMDSISIQVSPRPNISYTMSKNSLCEGDSLNIQLNGAASWDWYTGNINLNYSQPTKTVSPSSTTTYTVIGQNTSGCLDTTDITVTVHPQPSLQLSTNMASICANDTAQLSVSGASSFNWTPAASLSSSNGSTVQAFPANTTTYTLTGTDNNGCSSDTTVNVVVHPLPQINISTSDSIICKGQSTELIASGAQNWYWSPGGSLNTSFNDSVQASPMSNTTYSVTGTDANGCQASESILVQVFQGSQLTATPSSYEICMGDTATLSVQGAASYSWTAASGLIQSSGNTASVSPGANTSYQVTGTDSVGCMHTVSIPVSVMPLPSVNANSNLSAVCQGDSVQLWSSGANTYQWYDQGNIVSNQQQFIDQPMSITNYIVVGTDTNGCSNQASVNVNVNPLPALNINLSDSAICLGASATITASGANTYSWSPAATLNSTNGQSVVATPSVDTKYFLTGTSAHGCVATDSTTLSVNPVPNVSLAINTSDICYGDSVSLTATGASSYSWSHSQLSASTITHTPDSNITYTVTGVNQYGCADQATNNIIVHPIPVAGFTVDSVLCKGSSFSINNSTVNASAFVWNMDDGSTSTNSNPNHNYQNTGFYDIKMMATSNFGCVDSTSRTVQVIGLPDADFSLSADSGCAPLNIQYNNMSSGNYITYQWNLGNGVVTGNSSPAANNYSGAAYADTNYLVSLTVSNKCGSDVKQDTILVKTAPKANFGISNNYGCSPLNVQFANSSYGNAQAFHWDYGDGSSSTNQNPASHNFTYNGNSDTTYQIRLIAYNGCGTDTSYQSVTVRPQSVNAFFTPSKFNGCAPLTVDFSNYSTPGSVIQWDFDDGNLTTSLNPTHTFTLAGTYNVRLIVYDSCSVDTMIKTIHVATPPFADYLSNKDTICPGEAISFTNLSVNAANISWDFDDGSNSNLTNPTHVFDQPGVHHVKMVMQEQGTFCKDSITKQIFVRPGPVAGFSSSDLSGCQPLNISLFDTSQNVQYYHYQFGNGNSSNQPSPYITYNQPGNYKIWQYVENGHGCRDSAQMQIIVHPRPVSDFSLPNNLACDTPATVQLSNQSTGAVNYDWSFGNGSSSTLQHPLATYQNPGTYQIKLVSSNMYQCQDTSTANFVVSEPMNLEFKMNNNTGCEPLAVDFINPNSNKSISFLWDFGDSQTSSSDNPTHTYGIPGTYSVVLTATNDLGCKDTINYEDTIHVYAKPNLNFGYQVSDANPNAGKVEFQSVTSPVVSWYWDFDDGSTDTVKHPVHTFPAMGIYNVLLSVTNKYGCTNEIIKPVKLDAVKGLFVPNALAPSSMHKEVSTFKPKGKGLQQYWIGIYDKWGNLMWESSELDNGVPAEAWDGTFQGKAVPAGVYVWKVNAVFEDGSVWKGMKGEDGIYHPYGQLTLIR